MLRKISAVVVIVIAASSLGGCISVLETSGFDPQRGVMMDSYLNPGFSNVSPTTCYDRPSRVSSREDHCRVIRGYEGPNWPDDDRNWVISFDQDFWHEGPLSWFTAYDNPRYGEHPWHSCPSDADIDPYGCGIVMPDNMNQYAKNSPLKTPGWVFWGCVYNRSGNDYACDYRERFDKIMAPQPLNWLRATINWTTYVLHAVDCARSLYMFPIETDLLANCSDGPWSGNVDAGAPALPPGESPDPLGDVPQNVGAEQENIRAGNLE